MDSIVVFSRLRPDAVPRPQHPPRHSARRCLAPSIEAGRMRARAAPVSHASSAGAMPVQPDAAPVQGGPSLSSGTLPRLHPLRHG